MVSGCSAPTGGAVAQQTPVSTTIKPITIIVTTVSTSTSSTTLPEIVYEQTTTSSTTVPSTVPEYVECFTDSDCGDVTRIPVSCRGDDTFVEEFTPRCEFPGTSRSHCVNVSDLKTVLGGCEHGFCRDDVCWPEECEVECGGDCPPCMEEPVVGCNWKTDCGRDDFLPGTVCVNGSLFKEKIVYSCDRVEHTCSSEVVLKLFRECGVDEYCVPGEKRCVSGDTCDGLEYLDERDRCWRELAEDAGDASICVNIRNTASRKRCERVLA